MKMPLRAALVTAFAWLGLLAFAGGASAAIDIQRVVSPGGIEAWLVSENSLPMVTMTYSFRGGSAQEPADKVGLAGMLSSLLDEGAGDMDSEAFQTELDDLSIRLGFDSGRDTFGGSFRALDENRDEAARLLRLALTAPRFDKEPMERIRGQLLNGVRASVNNPQSVAGMAWNKAAFPDHPYGRSATADSLKGITADDLRGYMKRVLAHDNLKIAVVGNIDAAALGKLLDDVFGGLPAHADLMPVADVQPATGTRIEKSMNLAQTVIRFGGPGILRSDPDYVAGTIAAYILGGGAFTSRLYTEVREKRGYAYSVGLGLSPFDHAGMITGSTATRPDRADAAIDLIQSEIKRFAADGPTEQEVADAKSYLIGSYALRFDSSTAIAGQLLAIQLDNLGIDYINRRNDLVAAVTLDDVRRVAKRLFGGDMIIVKVGQAGS